MHRGAAQDYDELNSTPYGTDQQAYWSAFDTWEIEQASSMSCRRQCLLAYLCDCMQSWWIGKHHDQLGGKGLARS